MCVCVCSVTGEVKKDADEKEQGGNKDSEEKGKEESEEVSSSEEEEDLPTQVELCETSRSKKWDCQSILRSVSCGFLVIILPFKLHH